MTKDTFAIHHVGGIGNCGPAQALNPLGPRWIIYDAQESSLQYSSPNIQVVNTFVGREKGFVNFNLMDVLSASSISRAPSKTSNYTVILPNNGKQVWGHHCNIKRTITVACDSIDNLTRGRGLPVADFLSMDAQGSEMMILDGASEALDNSVGVVSEVGFSEIYEGQALFQDIAKKLQEEGFRLCEIFNEQRWNVRPYEPKFQGRGFLTVGEALFLREECRSTEQTLKLAAASVAFDQLDYCFKVLDGVNVPKEGLLGEISDALRTNGDASKVLWKYGFKRQSIRQWMRSRNMGKYFNGGVNTANVDFLVNVARVLTRGRLEDKGVSE